MNTEEEEEDDEEEEDADWDCCCCCDVCDPSAEESMRTNKLNFLKLPVFNDISSMSA
jgi:hypothetical protein